MRNPRLHQPSSSYLILSHRPFSLHTSIDIAQRTGNASSHHHIASSDFAKCKGDVRTLPDSAILPFSQQPALYSCPFIDT